MVSDRPYDGRDLCEHIPPNRENRNRLLMEATGFFARSMITLSMLLLAVSCATGGDASGPVNDSSATDTVSAPESARAHSQTPPDDSVLAPHLREKLDPALRLLLKDGPDHPFYSYESRQREGGGREYGVLIRTTAPDSLVEAGISLGPIPDEPGPVAIVTARLTPDEIRRIAALDIVESISNSSEARLH
jgi:hypothetical protein